MRERSYSSRFIINLKLWNCGSLGKLCQTGVMTWGFTSGANRGFAKAYEITCLFEVGNYDHAEIQSAL